MKKEKKAIGIFAAGLDRDHPGRFVKAICNKAKQQNQKVIIYNVFKKLGSEMNSFTKGEIQIFQKIPWKNISVLIIFTESLENMKVAQRLADISLEQNVPVISVDNRLERCHNVLFAYEESFERIVRHIVEHHGCEKINFMAGFENNEFSDVRIQTFQRVLKDNDIPFDEKRLAYGQFWEIPARIACEKWVSMWQLGIQEMPEAIICANDIMALTVCNVLTNHGIHVPEDVLLTGFDGLGLVKYCTPALTTAIDDMAIIGDELIELVRDCMDHPEMELKEICIPFQTVFSESCGCKPIHYCNPNEQIMEFYGRASEIRIQSNEIFFMMSILTDRYSVVDLAKKLEDYQYYIGVDSMLIFLNPAFYRETDVQFNESENDAMFLMSKIDGGEYSAPLMQLSQEQEEQMLEELIEKNGQLICVPIHQQEEQYGYMMASYADCAGDVGAFYEFVLALNQMLGTIKRQSELHRMFITDNLTELYNRRGFYGELERSVKELEGKKKMLFIASVDMDGLKYINDTYGHAEGDYAIKAAADILRRSLEGREGICARFGGDEFMVAILSEAEEADLVYYNAYESTLQKYVREFDENDNTKPYHIGVSIGCVHSDIGDLSEIDGLMKEADDIMYDCKASHKNSRTARMREGTRG